MEPLVWQITFLRKSASSTVIYCHLISEKMRFTGGCLFLAFAVFLDSIELISSAVTLDALYPGFNGTLPQVQIFLGDIRLFNNFQSCNRQPNVILRYATLLVRRQVIIGWLREDRILPPCSSQSDEDEFIVFNRTDPVSNGHWVALSAYDFKNLGPLRLYSLVKARDRVAQRNNVPRSSSRGILSKHKKACLLATKAANEVEEQALPLLALHRTTIPKIIRRSIYFYNHIYRQVMENPSQAPGSRRGTR